MGFLFKNNTLLIFGGMLINIILGYAVAKINTAFLTIEAFGMFSLFINFILLTRVFFSFGIFESSSRIIASQEDETNSREILASTLIMTFFVGLLLSIFILATSFYVDTIFEVKISFLLKFLWPLTFVLVFQIMLQVVLRGFGHMAQLSLYYFIPRLFYLCLMGALIYFKIFSLQNTAAAFLISILFAIIVFSYLPKPVFQNIGNRISEIKDEILTYGHHLYVANIFSAFFLHIDKLLLAYFLGAKELGYYALAYTISAPLPYFSSALSTSAFRKFASETRIQSRKLWINFLYVSVATVILLTFNKFIIEDLFSAAFAPARTTLKILIIAFAINALSVPYTMFFKAQKRGREIRNITLISQITFLVVNILLIPVLGIEGAAYASLIAYSLDFILYLIFYKRLKTD